MHERLIPAHAGKTNGIQSGSLTTGAHPRSRGENALEGLAGLLSGRLIPAHAGKTIPCDVHLFNTSAHPRSRGEN